MIMIVTGAIATHWAFLDETHALTNLAWKHLQIAILDDDYADDAAPACWS